jgi:glucuronokinase
LSGNHKRLGELIDENFDVRANIYRLDPRNVEMVKLARNLGASAHYAGSGGSILGTYHGIEMLRRLREEFALQGCRVIIPIVT